MEVLNKFKAVWLGNPEIRNVVNSIRELQTQIELLESLIKEGIMYSETLQIYKQQMALQAVSLMEAITISAIQQPTSYKMNFPYSYTSIYLAPAKLAAIRSQEICYYAKGIRADTIECGISAADIEQLQSTINYYLQHLQQEVITEKDSSTYKATLVNLYEKADLLLKSHLDNWIQEYCKTHPDFYQAFFKSRNH